MSRLRSWSSAWDLEIGLKPTVPGNGPTTPARQEPIHPHILPLTPTTSWLSYSLLTLIAVIPSQIDPVRGHCVKERPKIENGKESAVECCPGPDFWCHKPVMISRRRVGQKEEKDAVEKQPSTMLPPGLVFLPWNYVDGMSAEILEARCEEGPKELPLILYVQGTYLRKSLRPRCRWQP